MLQKTPYCSQPINNQCKPNSIPCTHGLRQQRSCMTTTMRRCRKSVLPSGMTWTSFLWLCPWGPALMMLQSRRQLHPSCMKPCSAKRSCNTSSLNGMPCSNPLCKKLIAAYISSTTAGLIVCQEAVLNTYAGVLACHPAFWLSSIACSSVKA